MNDNKVLKIQLLRNCNMQSHCTWLSAMFCITFSVVSLCVSYMPLEVKYMRMSSFGQVRDCVTMYHILFLNSFSLVTGSCCIIVKQMSATVIIPCTEFQHLQYLLYSERIKLLEFRLIFMNILHVCSSCASADCVAGCRTARVCTIHCRVSILNTFKVMELGISLAS